MGGYLQDTCRILGGYWEDAGRIEGVLNRIHSTSCTTLSVYRLQFRSLNGDQ